MKKQLIIPFFILHSSFLISLSAQNISTVAGNHTYGPGYSGDNGPATAAELNGPPGVAFDRSRNMYIADAGNQVIRKVDHSTGDISTIAGNNSFGAGYSGNGSPATAAELNYPQGVAVDTLGNIYIADATNNVIRKVDYSTADISTVAGNYAYGAGYSGDGSPATAAELNNPCNVFIDNPGNIYIADANNNVIRKVDHSTAIISTVAGNNTHGYSGDGNPATAAELNNPTGVSADASGNLFIADNNNQVIRKVDYSSGNISTVAGNHIGGYDGDGGPAINAEFYYPWDVKVDVLGNLFISDESNSVIREVYSSNGNINTIAGNNAAGIGYSGDGGPATSAQLNSPADIVLDNLGNLYIADAGNNVIREVNAVTVGIDKITSPSNDVNVYPNPGNGEFTIQWSGASPNGSLGDSQSSVTVYNILGEKVFQTLLPPSPKGALNKINLSSQPNGVYFIQIINQQSTICKQVVIAK